MTLSYDPPKLATPGIGRSPLEAFNYMARPNSTLAIRLPNSDCQIKPQVPLATLTSFRVGGPADWYAAPRCLEELQACFEWARSEGIPITLLGAGSNLLISDRGFARSGRWNAPLAPPPN